MAEFVGSKRGALGEKVKEKKQQRKERIRSIKRKKGLLDRIRKKRETQ